jgi:hypothetical protein
MRLLEFKKDTSEILKHLIERKCSDILKIYKDEEKVFYRGLRSKESYIIDNSPIYRQPVDTPLNIHDVVEDKLKSAGFKARRSNSIFVTSIAGLAKEFSSRAGNIFIVFPFNGFEFTTSELFDDFTNSAYTLFTPGPNSTKLNVDDFYLKILDMDPKYFVDKYQFQNTNISSPLQNGHEVYIHGKYLLVNNELFPNFIEKFL